MGNETIVGEVVNTAQSYFSLIIEGIVIVLIGFGIGILAKKFLLRILKELNLNKIMNKVGVRYDLEEIVSSIVSYVIYLFTIVIFLDKLGIKSIVLYLLVGAILMLIILTFLVGLKDVIPNFVAWLILQKKEKIKEGRYVRVKNISGRIEKVGFLETIIKTENGDVLYVPNSLFLKSKYWMKG